jgi:hypothetical protein
VLKGEHDKAESKYGRPPYSFEKLTSESAALSALVMSASETLQEFFWLRENKGLADILWAMYIKRAGEYLSDPENWIKTKKRGR